MKKLLLITLLFTTVFSLQITKELDFRLVGDFEGMRDSNLQCEFLAWVIERSKKGTYKITFYNDAQKSDVRYVQHGVWWTKDDKYFEQSHHPMGTAYEHNYKVKGSSIDFTMTNNSQSECGPNYTFTDTRIKYE